MQGKTESQDVATPAITAPSCRAPAPSTAPFGSSALALQHSYSAPNPGKEPSMPRGDKSSYSSKQKRRAEHIEEGYEKRGVRSKEAARRAWATVNKESGGGKKSGSGRGKKENRSASRKGGRKGGRARARSRSSSRS